MPRVELEYPGNTVCSHEVTVRLNDLSQASHLGFDCLVSIVHDAAAAFLGHLGVDITGTGEARIVFADLAVQYLSEAFRGDCLKIDMAVGDISSKGFEVFFKVMNQSSSRDVALARIGMVFFDFEKRCAMEIPHDIRMKI